MQEFLLFSQIPASREHQVLSILAGVTEQQPSPISEQHVLYAQVKLPEVAASKRGIAKQAQQQQIQRLSYHQLVRDVGDGKNPTTPAAPWRFRAEQTPIAGESDVISRTVEDKEASAQQIEKFKQPQWYRFQNQYFIRGNRFVHNNIVIRVYRMFSAPASEDPLDDLPPAIDNMPAVDASGSWIVDCLIRVEDSGNATLAGIAKAELGKFKDYMAGALDLYVPDRLSLDTRVKNV